MQFNKPLACPHIIRKEQVNGCILTRGPNKIKFNFCYENRDNSELFKELGLAVLQIVSKTPNGVIVFVSSYLMLDKVKQELSSCGVMTQLYAKKSIFFEKQNSHDFKPIL
jgi:Rad3-related DNA helicase